MAETLTCPVCDSEMRCIRHKVQPTRGRFKGGESVRYDCKGRGHSVMLYLTTGSIPEVTLRGDVKNATAQKLEALIIRAEAMEADCGLASCA